MRIFISYRVGDSDESVLLWKRIIERELGENSVYEYRSKNHPGEDFHKRLIAEIARCRYVLVFIGKHWGRNHSEDQIDWVKRELQDAMLTKSVIVPIFVDQASIEDVTDSEVRDILKKRHGITFCRNGDEVFIEDNILDHLSQLGIKKKTGLAKGMYLCHELALNPSRYLAFHDEDFNQAFRGVLILYVIAALVMLSIFLHLGVQIIASVYFQLLAFTLIFNFILTIVLLAMTIPVGSSLSFWTLKQRIVFGFIQAPLHVALSGFFGVLLPLLLFGRHESRIYYGLFEKLTNEKSGTDFFDSIDKFVRIAEMEVPEAGTLFFFGGIFYLTIYVWWQLQSITVILRLTRYSMLPMIPCFFIFGVILLAYINLLLSLFVS